MPLGVSGSASSATRPVGNMCPAASDERCRRTSSRPSEPPFRPTTQPTDDVACLALPRHHRALPHLRMTAQRRLDLPQLDTETPHFHLLVQAALVLQRSVRPPRPKSPVRYRRTPGSAENGSGTKRSAVRSPRPRYPRATCTPPMHSSPDTPTGTGRPRPSTTCIRVLQPAARSARLASSAARTGQNVTSTAASVGPYRL